MASVLRVVRDYNLSIEVELVEELIDGTELLVRIVHITERLYRVRDVEPNIIDDRNRIGFFSLLYCLCVLLDERSKILTIHHLKIGNLHNTGFMNSILYRSVIGISQIFFSLL